MGEETSAKNAIETTVTVDEVHRVLDLGHLLLSVLTPEEFKELQDLLYGEALTDYLQDESPVGNTSVT